MDMKYAPKALQKMFIVAAVLIILGAFNVYSSTYYMNLEAGGSPYSHLLRHIAVLAASIVIALALTRINYRFIRRFAGFWCAGTIVLLILVLVAGRTVNGATRWIMLGPVSLQPSEIAKITGLIWASSLLSEKVDRHIRITVFARFLRPFIFIASKKKENSFVAMLRYFTPFYMPLIMAAFIMKQPDMGTAGKVLMFPALLYIIAGMPAFEIILGCIVTAVVFGALAIAAPYRMARLIVLWDPFSYAQDLGYQTVQSLIAVGSGGLLGQGMGEGLSKFLYLPEQYTDFAFAVFSQEYGFIGSCAVLCLFMAFLYYGFCVARKLKDTYSAFLVYGLTLLISVQGLINIAMVIGCFPVTGIPLPFISFGGTSLLVNMAALGLIWGTSTQSLKDYDEQERKKRIAAMEGHPLSFGELSGNVYAPHRYRWR